MSTLVQVSNLGLSYGQQEIFAGISFALEQGEVLGVVGRNGCGKSSILKMLAGELDWDEGEINLAAGLTRAYVGQEVGSSDGSVLEYLAGGYYAGVGLSGVVVSKADIGLEALGEIESVAAEYGFSGLPDSFARLSGGQKRRLMLVRALLAKPDLLILDEPTNHLDVYMIQRLESLLKDFRGGVVVVSHDRHFLDNTANRLLEMAKGKIYLHQGGYTKYLENRSVRQEQDRRVLEKTEKWLDRELQWVRSGVKARGTKDKGRMQRFLGVRDSLPKQKEEEYELVLPEPEPLGSKILQLIQVSLDQSDRLLVEGLDFRFDAGMRVGLIGPNGSGKTTVLQAILGNHPIAKGKLVVGLNTQMTYMDQERVRLNPEATAFEEIGQGQEQTNFGNRSIGTRAYLRRFLFDNSRQMLPIRFLSGGERARVVLAKLLKQGGNFLLLDEPTNDLDLETIRLLEESLLAFEGCVVVVSHDRYFLNRVCTHIWAIQPDGKVVVSSGGYDDYYTKYEQVTVPVESNISRPKKDPYLKSLQAGLGQRKAKLTELERLIAKLEVKKTELEKWFADPEFYTRRPEDIRKARQKHLELEKELAAVYAKWVDLAD